MAHSLRLAEMARFSLIAESTWYRIHLFFSHVLESESEFEPILPPFWWGGEDETWSQGFPVKEGGKWTPVSEVGKWILFIQSNIKYEDDVFSRVPSLLQVNYEAHCLSLVSAVINSSEGDSHVLLSPCVDKDKWINHLKCESLTYQ